ncbi:MAG: FprA family A-type flavoprotein [Candidatus Asgardarchaeia archaeon]
MVVREIKTNIYFVGAIDWDRRLFDSLIPLPDGTSYNAYVIKGSEKIALIDTVDPAKENELIANLKELKIEQIDYIISNHAEQDHSGAIPRVLELYPMAKVVTNAKGKQFLIDLLNIHEDKFIVVNDGDTISLGNKTLEFIFTPWVHWPETMVTYLKEDRILFSCDFLASHLATSDLYVTDESKVYEAAKRYYAEIMLPFRKTIMKNLEKIEKLKIELIAPSHGPIYNKPEFILNAYREWSSDNLKNLVIIVYVSMHGSTQRMVHYLTSALIERGITVEQFNLVKTDLGKLATSLVDAATIVVATPTLLTGAHPSIVYAAYLLNLLRPKIKYAAIIGSYSWGTNVVNVLKGVLPNFKAEILDVILTKGLPKQEDFEKLNKLADSILKKHKELNLVK